MKKALTIAALVLVALACHRKAVPAGTTSTPEPLKSDVAHDEMIGQGKTVYTTRCGRCHALKPVENYTADRWTGILKSMIPKAKLTDTEAEQVTAYVMANAKK